MYSTHKKHCRTDSSEQVTAKCEIETVSKYERANTYTGWKYRVAVTTEGWEQKNIYFANKPLQLRLRKTRA